MKLLRLTLQGFKSFADKTTIEFADGMTVIVVTQKHQLLRDVDNIMLLADGQIAAFGSRDQMLARLSNRQQPGPAAQEGLANA